MVFAIPADYRVKLKESEKKDKYIDLAREQKKTIGHRSDGDINCNKRVRYSQQRLSKETSGDHPKYSITKICQNTEKSLGDLRRLAVTQTPVENHQLTLVWKTLKWV